MNELRKEVERKVFGLVAILIATNAYFVQRVIASVDMTTTQIVDLKEHVARIEQKIEDLHSEKPAKWKKL